ncbi:xylose reductase [Syncephalastrum racemosum]|uniref:Xylose reductase n=1 Tax=Syncephalastrum racemosum TaxID=13706 RepID=A0A1X2GZP1_SYNRA|nr:xylose reductase [Syncephalastrum racemosum]
MTIEYMTLQPSGDKMPLIGFGCAKIDPEATAEVIYNAIKVGYRLFDGGSNYYNEKEVGDGIRKAIADGLVERKELFVISKLWNTHHGKDHVRLALEKSLQDLGLDYVDMYLIHFPVGTEYVPIETKYPAGWCVPGQTQVIRARAPMHECWAAMEACVDAGLARNIGVSNFNVQSLMDLLSYCRIQPSLLQVELHPYHQQPVLVDWVQRQGIAVAAYSSFGPASFAAGGLKHAKAVQSLFENPTIKDVAAKYNTSPAQVLLRWSLERNVGVVPKSLSVHRMKDNLEALNWKMDEEDVQAINQLEMRLRFNDPIIKGWDLPIFY